MLVFIDYDFLTADRRYKHICHPERRRQFDPPRISSSTLMLVLTIKYSSQSIMISIAVIVIFVMFSPTVLLPDMLQHVDVEGGVEGDVGNQLQRLLAHLCLLNKEES